MSSNISAGHNPDNKIACGTVNKKLNMYESTEARYIAKKVVEYLKNDGEVSRDCTVNNGTGQTDVLDKLKAKHNAHSVDWNVSIHFNDTDKEDLKGNDKNIGVEVWYFDNKKNPTSREECRKKAELICSNISSIGFTNRHAKSTTGLRFLKDTVDKAVLIEVCFCSDIDDVKLYKANRDNIARAIANAIEGKTYKYKEEKNIDKIIAYSGEVDKIAATVLGWKLKDYKLSDSKDIKNKKSTNVIAIGGSAEKELPNANKKIVGKDRFETLEKVLEYIKTL